jgi:hypothetical protein
MPPEDGIVSTITKLFVWGNNEKWQLGIDEEEDLYESSQDAKEISVPH